MSREERVAKLAGADIELGNFVLGIRRPGGTGYEASRALLRQIDAPYAERRGQGWGGAAYDRQDWGRKHLAQNGGCAYVDLDHLELCIPEVWSAWDHVAAWHAMLRIARRAMESANALLPEGQAIQVLVCNSDGLGNAFGSHLNFLVTRKSWDDIFERKLHHLLFLAAFQVSSIVYTGAGKVGSENGAPPVAFQLSQRADFFETLTGSQTTTRRPLVNSRDESLCGSATDGNGLARLHSIFFDSTLCHGSSLLKVGTMQLVLAMLEAEVVDPRLLLDEPVAAVRQWSHDPTLARRVRLASGKRLTAVELQLLFLEAARRFAATGGFDGIVPRADDILALWEDTLVKLRARSFDAVAGRLDWVLRLRALHQAMERRPGLDWASPAIRHLDQLYGALDADAGLYWMYERQGAVERHVEESRIARFVEEPPEDTRAWTRAMLLRLAEPGEVQDVDWDLVRFRRPQGTYWPSTRVLHLDDPRTFTKAASAPAFAGAATLDDALDALGATPAISESIVSLYDWGRAPARAWSEAETVNDKRRMS